MAKLVIEKWQCDRCGTIKDKRPYGNGCAHHEVRVSVDYETAGGPLINWLEMCASCDNAVAAELAAMKASAKLARSSA